MKVAWWPKFMSTLGMNDNLMVNECQKILFGILITSQSRAPKLEVYIAAQIYLSGVKTWAATVVLIRNVLLRTKQKWVIHLCFIILNIDTDCSILNKM